MPRVLRFGWIPVVLLFAALLAAGPAGAATDTVYIADITGAVYQFDVASGNSSPYLINAQLQGAVGVVQEPSGDLLVSTTGSNTLWRIDHVSKALTVLSAHGLMQNPTLMGLIGPEAFVADPVALSIIGVNRSTGAQRTVVSGGLSNGGPWMCAGSDGFLYVSRNSNTTIVRVDPATGVEHGVAAGGQLSNILGITYGPDNFLYVCCGGTHKLIRVDPSNGQQLLVTTVSAGNPYGISAGPDGYLWVGIEASNKLVRVHPVNGAQTPYTITGMSAPYGVLAVGSATGLPSPPGAPLTCSASDDRPDSVVVQWTAGSGQIDGYQIDRDGTTIATLASTVSRYAERPTAGPHNYCVRAINLGGSSGPTCDSGQLKVFVSQPHLDFVRDVPNDQGGKVMLGWTRSDLDVPGGTITGYRVWRRLPAAPSLSPASFRGREIRTFGFGPQTEYWEALTTLPVGHLDAYGYVAPTLQDSLPGSNPKTAFFISALTNNPDTFYSSNVDSGYSVDNLAPDIPQGIQGAYLASGGVKIQWLPSRAADLGLYRVYRGVSENFTPAEFNRIGETTDTTLVDPSGAAYYYKLSAVDVHGNESGFALLKPSEIPVAALLQTFEADPIESGIKVSIDLAAAMSSVGIRLWRSLTESRLGAVALTPDAVPVSGTHFEFLDAEAPKDRVWYWADLDGPNGFEVSFGPITALAYGALPTTILLAPQPNPSLSNVSFSYTVGSDLAGSGEVSVRLALYDVRGKLVRTLVSGTAPVGSYHQVWDGNDERGVRVRTGAYQYKLQVGAQARSGNIIRL